MPGSFTDQKERSREELKPKGRVQRERQWGSEGKGFSVLLNVSRGMVSLWRGLLITSIHSGAGTNSLSLS